MDLIQIPAADGTAEAYVAQPPAGEGPGVLFFIDAIGLRPRIEEMADRIASWGYVVLAPNLFYRSGTAAELSPTRDLREPGAREEFFASIGDRTRMGPATMLPDLDHYVRALGGLEGVWPGPFAVTGYCLGARFATYAATRFPDDVVVAAGFHGAKLVTDDPDSPHAGLARAKAEFVYGHADQDASNPAEAVATLGQALRDAGLAHTNEIYPGAPHGFTMADTSMYDEAGAERSFEQLHEALRRRLPA